MPIVISAIIELTRFDTLQARSLTLVFAKDYYSIPESAYTLRQEIVVSTN